MKTRLQLFSLSFFLTLSLSRYRSLPRSLSPFLHWSFIVKFALGYGFLSLARRFSLDIFFFVGTWLSLLLCRCTVSFRALFPYLSLVLAFFLFFPDRCRRDRHTRCSKKGTWSDDDSPNASAFSRCVAANSAVCFVVEFFRERERDPKGFKGAEIVSAVMKYAGAGAVRLILRFTFLRVDEATGG